MTDKAAEKRSDRGTSPRAVRSELDAMLASRTFAQSESLKKFLRHVVEAKLDGRDDELKEFALGSDVFGRGDDYDPRIDPIVRVQATRLRGKLAEYYQNEGSESPVTIELPKGTYVPTFRERRPGRSDDEPVSMPSSGSGASWLPWALGAAVLVLAFVGFWRLRGSNSGNGIEVRSLAVLPFTDMSPDGDQQFYGDGLADEITTTLASVGEIDVAPRTSAFRFRDSAEDLTTVGATLDVDAVLQGSVRKFDDRLRLSVQLIRVADGKQLWSQSYDRADVDAFAVQDEIAANVARALLVNLSDLDARRADHIPDGGAYEDYLRGRFELERNTPTALERSIALFESALDKDPDYAPAYAGLVRSYAGSTLWGLTSPEQTREPAREASERAVTLDADHPEAFAAAAAYQLLYEWNVDRAESILERGLERSPASHELLLMRALAQASRGRLGEAARDLDEAASLSPRAPLVRHLRAAIDFYSEAYSDAVERCQELLEWDPDYPLTWLLLSRAEARLGELAAANDALDDFERLAGTSALSLSHRAVLRALEGRMEEGRALVRQIEAMDDNGYVPPLAKARAHAALGEVGPALENLEMANREGSFSILWLTADPDFASLHGEPSFQTTAGRFGVTR